MKKVYIVSAFVFLIFLVFIVWDVYKSTAFNQNYYDYYKRSLDYIIAYKNDICIIKNENGTLSYFKVEGTTSDHRLCVRFGMKPSAIPIKELEKIVFTSDGQQIHRSSKWLSDLSQDNENWQKKLTLISQSEIQKLNSQNSIYCYHKRLSKFYRSHQGIIAISFFSGLIIILYVMMVLMHKLKVVFPNKNHILSIISLSLFSLIGARFFSEKWFSVLFIIFLFKNLITYFGLFLVIQKVNEKYANYDFGKRELLKFVGIAIYAFLAESIGGFICDYLYFKVFGGGFVYQFGDFDNFLGWYKFWIYFAIVNFLANLTFYILRLRKEENEFKTLQLAKLEASTTIASIQSRINPHFLYNALNSVASLSHTEPLKTEQMINELARFYTEYADKSHTAIITLREELEILKSYINIEKIRFGEKLDVRFLVPKEALEVEIPAFILQPLVENAIKLGYNQNTERIDILIIISNTEMATSIKVIDHGKPFSEQIESGFGIDSVRKKLKWLMPNHHELTFVNGAEKYVEIILKPKKI